MFDVKPGNDIGKEQKSVRGPNAYSHCVPFNLRKRYWKKPAGRGPGEFPEKEKAVDIKRDQFGVLGAGSQSRRNFPCCLVVLPQCVN